MEIKGLIEGRIVHVVLADEQGRQYHRPAIVVAVWNRYDGCCNLQVFVDGSNDRNLEGVGFMPDGSPRNTVWKTSIHYSEQPIPNTWHWIEKEEGENNG